jgi:hypothetical protein
LIVADLASRDHMGATFTTPLRSRLVKASHLPEDAHEPGVFVARTWRNIHVACRSVYRQLDYAARRRAPGLQARRVRWLGHEASEVELAESVVRVTAFGDTLVAAQVIGPRGLRAQPSELAGFFSNVELTK